MKPRVLLAEADGLHAAACRAFLSAEGVECHVVASGLDCLAYLRQSRPEVLVLDADLPWGSGLGELTGLREEGLADLPVVLLTDRPGRLAEEMSGAVVLLKPVTPLRLTATIVGILDAVLRQPVAASLVLEREGGKTPGSR
jgi:DNA-binding response OmpR family regulator